ncbi:MAG: DinB family protein [Candidatus Hodarchaeales archaeon]
MLYEFLKKAIFRHFIETRILLTQLSEQTDLNVKIGDGRSLGEIILHIIRSIEYYTRGLAEDIWDPLPYSFKDYNKVSSVLGLYDEVVEKAKANIERLKSTTLEQTLDQFNKRATKAEIILEMLEHSVQHRGQILVYYRFIGVKPEKIQYIV